MSLKEQLEEIDKQIDNPSMGLPEEVFEFATTITPMINVDLLIKDKEGRVLMSWRDDICGTGWHIPGGIIRYKENIKDRILAVAKRELGTVVSFDEAPLMINEIMMPHRVRGHFISLLYRCYVDKDFDINNGNLKNTDPGYLSWLSENPGNIVMGQKDIYKDLWDEKY